MCICFGVFRFILFVANSYDMLLACNNCKKIVDFLNVYIQIKPESNLLADKLKQNYHADFAASLG